MPGALLDTTFFIDYHRGDAGAHSLWLEIAAGAIDASFIAATAAVREQTIYTRNVRDFRRFHSDVERY